MHSYPPPSGDPSAPDTPTTVTNQLDNLGPSALRLAKSIGLAVEMFATVGETKTKCAPWAAP